jgi:hypothetical protein
MCHPDEWSQNALFSFNGTRHGFKGYDFEPCSCAYGSLQCPPGVEKATIPTFKVTTKSSLIYLFPRDFKRPSAIIISVHV